MKVKDTLNLGKTEFPMRGNLPVREAVWQKNWEEEDLYGQRQKLNEGKPTFVLHDGPPYANNNIHIGHAMNKISKDIIVRFKSMSGFRSPFVPGWDTHGLPIEQELTKKGVNRKEMSIAEFREKCKEYALKQVDLQRNDFKRLGISADWGHPYITLDPAYEADEIRVFGKMAEKGYIYQGQKPVYWSPSSESALAEAEIEYHDIKSPSIYVAFKVVDGKGLIDTDTAFIIWTTTPWTMPANEAIAVNPRFNYIQIDADGNKYVIAEDLLNTVKEKLEWHDVKVLKTLKGAEFEYMTAKHPFYDRTSLLILGDHVTLETGTGLVHTAPGHGDDDYIVGKKYDLPILSPVDAQGKFTDEAPGFEGMFYNDANPIITKMMEDNGSLLKLEFFTHSYPHDWRTKKPVIFRATPQWFASVEAFRADILAAVKTVKFNPDWGETRLYNMIRDRGDWVISRQRAWGVPLPIFYAENDEPIITKETIDNVAKLFGEFGSNIWFERDAKELLPAGFTHPGSPNGIFRKETDIMDVWFDSGSSHQSVLNARPNLTYPADLILEGSDQYRGWFNSSIITSVAINNIAPYKEIISQGFTLDGNGLKMSKSGGNAISPNKVVQQLGAEIIRLWVATIDTSSDVKVSMDVLNQAGEGYRKIRNTMRFMLANTTDFIPGKNTVAYDNLDSVDKYMLIRLNQVVEHSIAAYDKYDFPTVYKEISSFLTNELSSFYLDFAKDIVYIEAEDSAARRNMQTVFYEILVDLTKLLTPMLPHTAEEIWEYLKETESFVQLAEMPEVNHYSGEADILETWAAFMEVRSQIQKALELARDEKVIGKSLEAAVTLYVSEPIADLLKVIDADIKQLCIVSELSVVNGEDKAPADSFKAEGLTVHIVHANGEVCDRCRMTKTDVGSHPDLPHFCDRCATIVEKYYPESLTEGFE